MIAYHYPPCFGSSGVLRTLKHSRSLPKYGWQPIVLTAHPRAYEQTSPQQLGDIPADMPVSRAFALDSRRHLAIRGRTPRALTLPDRWVSWWLGAVPAGLRLVRRYRPRAIWSTYPIATAHLVGLTLHRLTGLPWLADFRDSMTEDHYPPHPLTRKVYRWIERQTVARAARVIFTAPSARRMYLERYPWLPPDRCTVIPNGYDEEDFVDIGGPVAVSPSPPAPLRLVHAGLVYTEERDPTCLFSALSRLKRSGALSAHTLRVDLRASGAEQHYARVLAELDIADIVHLLPALPYRAALRDAASADGLLLLQGATCNHQIPAKVYEYFRLGKPILALTADEGDTAGLLKAMGGSTIVDLHAETAIFDELPRFLTALQHGDHPVPDPARARRYTRDALTADLARCLESVNGRPPGLSEHQETAESPHGETTNADAGAVLAARHARRAS